jgi:hypothetical protein
MSWLAASRQLREIDLPVLPPAWPDACRPIDTDDAAGRERPNRLWLPEIVHKTVG